MVNQNFFLFYLLFFGICFFLANTTNVNWLKRVFELLPLLALGGLFYHSAPPSFFMDGEFMICLVIWIVGVVSFLTRGEDSFRLSSGILLLLIMLQGVSSSMSLFWGLTLFSLLLNLRIHFWYSIIPLSLIYIYLKSGGWSEEEGSFVVLNSYLALASHLLYLYVFFKALFLNFKAHGQKSISEVEKFLLWIGIYLLSQEFNVATQELVYYFPLLPLGLFILGCFLAIVVNFEFFTPWKSIDLSVIQLNWPIALFFFIPSFDKPSHSFLIYMVVVSTLMIFYENSKRGVQEDNQTWKVLMSTGLGLNAFFLFSLSPTSEAGWVFFLQEPFLFLCFNIPLFAFWVGQGKSSTALKREFNEAI